MKLVMTSVSMVLLLSGCFEAHLFQPTAQLPPSTTATVTQNNSPTPRVIFTLTQTLTAEYLSLPEIPSGYKWKVLPESKLAVIIPDEWFFQEENFGIKEIYITKEKIDNYRKFSTGLRFQIFENFKDSSDAKRYSVDLLNYYMDLDAEKEVLAAWDEQTNSYTAYHRIIKAGFPFNTHAREYETVQISTIQADNRVYLSIFQSPTELWEQNLKDYGILLDYIIINN